MEEVWRDISLNQDMPFTPPLSLHYHDSSTDPTTATPSTYFKGITMQDILSREFREAEADQIPPMRSHCPPSAPFSLASARFSSSCNGENSFSNRHPELMVIMSDAFSNGDGNVVDRRKKRLIKNRESAARSRARKQAYTNELEKELHHLAEDNGKLKLKCEELRKQAMASQLAVAKKRQLQRTSSAPF